MPILKKSGFVKKERKPAAPGNVQNLSRIAAVSVAVAILAVGLGAYMLYTGTTKLSAAEKQMTRIVVAQADMGSGHTISMADIAVKELPKDAVADGAVEDANSVIGKLVTSRIPRGAAVTEGSLAGAEADTAAGRVAAGHVAISIAASQQSGVAGLVHQGDRVSVLGATGVQGEASASVLAEHARVLALDAETDAYSADYTAITLEVEPAEAQKIAEVQSASQITLALESASTQEY